MKSLPSKKFDNVSSPTGFWFTHHEGQTNYKSFQRKIEALQHATADKQLVGFYFHNTIWDNFDKTTLGKNNLTRLYSERAKQLRDKYEYLVLHYSGGSDSHNILHTFLTNNIKLDEITVRWPKHWIEGKFYTPNNTDTSAKNAPSEFNYTIQPTLEYLRTYHPSIKINIVNFTENIHSLTTAKTLENRILTINSSRSALSSVVQRLDINVDRNMVSTNIKNIGHIFGIEKPALFLENDELYFYFTDVAFDTISMEQGSNVEPFYWTGDMPELTMEQIYRAGLYFKDNPQHRHLLNSPNKQINQVNMELNIQQNILKSILYSQSWDFSKFQVDKPNVDRSDWHSWIHETPELSKLNNIFDGVMRDITSSIDTRFLVNLDKTPLLSPRRTKLFHLMSLS